MNTNWSTPKTNILAGMLDLRQALASGNNARLRRARNEDCSFPIKTKEQDTDFRNYEFSSGTLQNIDDIANDAQKSEFLKYLTLNYKTCYGAAEAAERYYKTGLLSQENFKGMGTSHLIKVSDMIAFYESIGNKSLADMFRQQYLAPEDSKETHFFDNYVYKHGSPWAIKEFKNRLWVVELLDNDEAKAKTPVLIKILNIILYPTKFIPTKSVLRMDTYRCVTYRIGDVTNGFSVEFNIPKKFGFN